MEINLGKDSCTSKLIKENVDVGQWVLVLDGDGIQRSVVNT
jgi:hydrogenase maturation factor